jgi:peptide/nickel transport system permease protein
MTSPPFWLALMAISFFSLRLQLFPPMGMSFMVEGGPLDRLNDLLWHLALPVAVLTIRNLATWSRYIRSSLLEVMGEDYIRTAYSKGLSEVQVIMRHGLKNSLLPLITIMGLSLPECAGRSIFIVS